MITSYRQAVVSHLRAQLTQLECREVGTHGGVFSVDEARRKLSNSPSVHVAILGIRPGDAAATGESVARAQMAAYIFTTHHGTVAAETLGWALATRVVTLLSGEHLLDGTLLPEEIEIESLWSGELDRNGSCILAVVWAIDIVMGRDWLATDLQITDLTAGGPGTVTVEEGSEIVAPTLP